ncbi:MAG TPA: flagellar brake protein [Mariprofundaceae bacterium]|nr:flagellar brake protein [Mariprofundaceae bacterium]
MTTDNHEEFLVHSRTEILALLRGLRKNHELVTAHFDQGRESMLTTILSVLEDRNILILDYGVNEALNRNMLESDKVVFTTTYNRVKIQFSTESLKKVRYDKLNAFKMEIPDSVLRIQRREHYRIDTPVINPLCCLIPVHIEKDAVESETTLKATVVNISVGGVGIVDVPPQAKIESGRIYRGCRIGLPGTGTLEVDMEVVNIYEISSKKGGKTTRYGCRFIDLKGSMQAMIQRYVLKLEREQQRAANPI